MLRGIPRGLGGIQRGIFMFIVKYVLLQIKYRLKEVIDHNAIIIGKKHS